MGCYNHSPALAAVGSTGGTARASSNVDGTTRSEWPAVPPPVHPSSSAQAGVIVQHAGATAPRASGSTRH
jgi:hypothetical protein